MKKAKAYISKWDKPEDPHSSVVELGSGELSPSEFVNLVFRIESLLLKRLDDENKFSFSIFIPLFNLNEWLLT